MRPAEGDRVVFLNHAADETGPPVVLLALQRWLRANTELAFTTVHGAGGRLLERFEALGETRVLHHRWGPDVVVGGMLTRAGLDGSARRLAVGAARARLTGLRGDLVVVNALAPTNLVSLRALAPAGPVISHVHELSVILEHRLSPTDRRFALERSDHFVVVSEAVRRYLADRHGVPEERTTLVREFIEAPPAAATDDGARRVRAELGLGPTAPLVVGCGSTDWRKAPDLFVRAAWELRRRRPDLDATWAWVGHRGGATEHLVDFELERLGLSDRVRFVGVRSDPSSWFAAADVFALPSREDPFPLVCIEAAAVGTPVVCFDAGGIVELVEPARAGAVVPYPDTGAFADAVAGLLDDPEGRHRAGQRGAAAVRAELLVEHQAPRFLEVLRRHLPGRPARPAS